MSGYNEIAAKNTPDAPQAAGLHSQSVAFSHYNNLSAQLPLDPKSGAVVAGGVKEQARQCLENIQAILHGIDHKMDDVVRTSVFVRHIADLDAVDAVVATFFGSGYVPARTAVAVAALPMDALVQIEALVSHGEGSIPGAPQAGDLVKVARNTDAAPQSPLSSQTVAFSHYNNLSAQLPLDPKTGALVAGGAAEQARQCMHNIEAILKSIGHEVGDVVRVTLFATSLADAQKATEVCATFFTGNAPAMTVLAVSCLPLNALVQIEAVVSHGDGTPPQAVEDARNIVVQAHSSADAPKGAGSQTVAFSHYNHVSAQLPLDPKTGALVPGGVKEQTAQCLKNIQAIVESVDHALGDVVKVNIALKNMADLAAVDAAYTTFLPRRHSGAQGGWCVGTAHAGAGAD